MITSFQKSGNKKYILALSVVLLAVFVFIALAPDSDAATGRNLRISRTGKPTGMLPSIATNVLNGIKDLTIVYGILVILKQFLAWLLAAAGAWLSYAFFLSVQPGFFSGGPVEAGWLVVRDVANIFIVLILLFIAIATILRFDSYGVKRNLVLLIIAALMINFSLPLAKTVIDFSNILTNLFIPVMSSGKVLPDSQIPNISDNLANALKLQEITGEIGSGGGVVGSPATTGALNNSSSNFASGNFLVPEAHALAPLAVFGIWLAKQVAAAGAFVAVTSALDYIWGSGSLLGQFSVKEWITLITTNLLLLVAVYVMLALSIMLMIRTIVLMFLLVLSPAAVAFFAFPSTRGYGTEWMTTFLKQSLFAPALAFLLYLTISLGFGVDTAITGVSQTGDAISNPFSARLFFFVFFLAMFYACLLFAKRMGAYGADTAINLFNKGKTFAVGAVAGVALRNTIGRAGEAMQRSERLQKYQPMRRLSTTMAKAGGKYPGGSRAEQVQEKAEYDLAATFRKSAKEQPRDFANYKNVASKEAYVEKVLKDPKKLSDFMRDGDDAAKGEFLRIARLKGGADAERTFQKAEREYQRNKKLAEGESIGTFMAGISPDIAKEHFKDMEDEKRSELYAQWQGDAGKRAMVNDWAKGLKPDEQERFYTGAVRKSAPALQAGILKGLSTDLQNKVVENMPARDVAAMKQNAGANAGDVEAVIKRLPTEKQERVRDEEARGEMKDLDTVAAKFGTLPDEIKKSLLGAIPKEDLEKLTGKVTDKDKFLEDVKKYAPNKVDGVLAVLPTSALKAGQTPQEVVKKTNFDRMPDSEMTPEFAKHVAENASEKQFQKVMFRGGPGAERVLENYQKMYDAAGKNMEKLAEAFDKAGNKQMATWILTNENKAKKILRIKDEPSGGRGGKGGGASSGGGGGTSGGGGTPPSAALPTDISSPSVKAGSSFKNEFEGKVDAEYAIAESEKQLSKRKQSMSPSATPPSTSPPAPRRPGPLYYPLPQNSPNTAPSLDKMTEAQKKAFRDTLPDAIRDSKKEIGRLNSSLMQTNDEGLKKAIRKLIQNEANKIRRYEEEMTEK